MKKTILLVEDEFTCAAIEDLFLEQYGYSVVVASSGEEAIELLRDNTFIDLILMDINLGDGMNGIVTAQKILIDRDIPIIFLSSHHEPEFVEQTEKVTCYGYILKNSGISIIDASIKMALKLSESKKYIQHLLDEKELILKEVHHRIKNNMNTINSLLSIKSQSLVDPKAIAIFENAQSILSSMVVLYDNLYRAGEFVEINMKDFINPLIDQIMSHFPHDKNITIVKSIEDFTLDSQRAQPIGILINELLTNIMKYAFKEVQEGTISVIISKFNGKITLIVSDDGIGIPDTVDFENHSGFGLTLIQGLVKQIKGSIEIERSEGSKFIIEFDR